MLKLIETINKLNNSSIKYYDSKFTRKYFLDNIIDIGVINSDILENIDYIFVNDVKIMFTIKNKEKFDKAVSDAYNKNISMLNRRK